MITGMPLFWKESMKSNKKLFKTILYESPDLSSEFLSKNARNLIAKLLMKNPSSRLTDPTKIKSHPFFNEIDWDLLSSKKLIPPYIPILSHLEDTAHFNLPTE